MTHASGTFEVKLTPQPPDNKSEDPSLGRMSIEKQFHGELEGTGFVLQHSGTMTRGAPQLLISLVPDSGTGQLAGLAGAMTIRIADGKHFYDFDYTLADTG